MADKTNIKKQELYDIISKIKTHKNMGVPNHIVVHILQRIIEIQTERGLKIERRNKDRRQQERRNQNGGLSEDNSTEP